jgi:hypothetical protein
MVHYYNQILLRITHLEQRNAWLVTGKTPQRPMPQYHVTG